MFLKQAFQLASPHGERGRLSILIFHRVLSVPDPLFPDEPDVARFEQIVKWLKGWFNVLPLNEAVMRLQRGNLPPRAAAITFDDGYADNLINATPILQKHQLHATYFIATTFLDGGIMWNDKIIESIRRTTATALDAQFLGLGYLDLSTIEHKRQALTQLISAIKHRLSLERAEVVEQIATSCAALLPNDLMLTSTQLRELRNTGMGIGAHTVNHPILARIDSDSALKEIANSRDFLQYLLGERISLFAYPNGRSERDYTIDHANLVRDLGFDAAVTTNPGVARKTTDPFQLPRFTPWDRTRARFGLRLLFNSFQSR